MMFRTLAPLCSLAILVFAGCAGVTPQDLALVRAHGVPAPVVRKLAENRVLTPPEIISLAKHGVPDSVIERHLESAGVDYLITPADAVHMRRGGVSERVIDAVLVECERFARRHASAPYGAGAGYWWTTSVAYGPDLYFDAW